MESLEEVASLYVMLLKLALKGNLDQDTKIIYDFKILPLFDLVPGTVVWKVKTLGKVNNDATKSYLNTTLAL